MNLLEARELSPNVESIYYADLFVVGGRVWMITGCGKSGAGRIASKKELAADLARDAVALVRDGNSLYGGYDPGALATKDGKPIDLHRLHKIDVIAYCLSADETATVYANRQIEIDKVDHTLVAALLSRMLYPAYVAQTLGSAEQLRWLQDPTRRHKRFLELTNAVDDVKFLVIPWMPSVEEKAELYVKLAW